MGARIIFLDVDGVLNSAAFLEAQTKKQTEGAKLESLPEVCAGISWSAMLDPTCVHRLDRLVRETDAKVVISSSWRHAMHYTALAALLRGHGFTGNVIDQTAELDQGRPVEIALWVSEHRAEIDGWVAIDDMNLAALNPNFVQTSWAGGGLSDADVEAAKAVLLEGRGVRAREGEA